MQCPACRRRPARRPCPALDREICPVCCGTKRMVEIACPAACGYLVSAQAHPAAIVRKQQERDVALMSALMRGLGRGQQQLAWSILGFLSRAALDPLLRVQDEDVADMAESLAATLRTAQRGVIYEHRPRSLVAQRLSTDVKAFLEQQHQERGDRGFEQDVAAALEQIARAFRDGSRVTGAAGVTACLTAVGRVLREADAAAQADTAVIPAGTLSGPKLIQP